jgi:hypothetical protein
MSLTFKVKMSYRCHICDKGFVCRISKEHFNSIKKWTMDLKDISPKKTEMADALVRWDSTSPKRSCDQKARHARRAWRTGCLGHC